MSTEPHGEPGLRTSPPSPSLPQQHHRERLRAEAGSPGPGGEAAVREGWGPGLSLTHPSLMQDLRPELGFFPTKLVQPAALLSPEAWRLSPLLPTPQIPPSGPVATNLCSALPTSTAPPAAAWVTTVAPFLPGSSFPTRPSPRRLPGLRNGPQDGEDLEGHAWGLSLPPSLSGSTSRSFGGACPTGLRALPTRTPPPAPPSASTWGCCSVQPAGSPRCPLPAQ